MGTMLYALGIKDQSCFDVCNIMRSALVQRVHDAYYEAGAEIIRTNTYGANRFKLVTCGYQKSIVQVNAAGAVLAVEARRLVGEHKGRRVFVAGAVGPLGQPLSPLGSIALAEARDAFKEQIEPLVASGVDVLMLEAFDDLTELEQAVVAARAVTANLPIVALVAFGEDRQTQMGNSPKEIVKVLEGLGVDALGASCGVGPRKMAQLIGEIATYATKPIAALPAAGRPERVDDRIVYVSSPEYIAEYAQTMVQNGVKIVGGCCGTTPQHIQAIADAVRGHAGAESTSGTPAERTARDDVGSPFPVRVKVPSRPYEGATIPTMTPAKIPVTLPAVSQDTIPGGMRLVGKSVHETPGSFSSKLGLEFVVSIELDPRRGLNADRLLDAAQKFADRGVDAVNIAENALGRTAVSAISIGAKVLQAGKIPPIVHITTCDRTLSRLQSDLLGAHVLGIRHLVILMGDPSHEGGSSDLSDIRPSGLIKHVTEMNKGRMSQKSMGDRTDFLIGCVFNPNASDPQRELDALGRKVAAGAHFVITQPVYDIEQAARAVEITKQFNIHLLLGVLPLFSYRMADYLHNEVAGVRIPEELLRRMQEAGDNDARVGLAAVQEVLQFVQNRCAGAYLIPQSGRYEFCLEALEVFPRFRKQAS
jgi:homocysteine S-methyltransferase